MSIIQKAGELGKAATLVVGAPGGGKSSVVRDAILRIPDVKPLWVAFNNTAALVPDETDVLASIQKAKAAAAKWDIAVPGNWNEFDVNIAKPASEGKFSGEYNVLVIDGANVMAAMLLSKIAPGGQPSQPEWLQMSNQLRDKFIAVRDRFAQVFYTVDVVPNKDGVRELDLNRHSANLLTPLFGHRWFAYALKGKEGKPMTYGVQKNPALAMEFQINKE